MSSNVNSVIRKTGSATLMIENFNQLTTFRHVPLYINGVMHFFGVRPKTTAYTGDYVTIYLISHGHSFKFKANVSILNSKGEKLFTKDYSGEFGNGIEENYFSLMPLSKLLLPQNGYLSYDKLTLLCETEVIEDGQRNEMTVESICINLNNLSENLKSLLSDGNFTDATLVIGTDGKEFKVHKNILAARSPVFAAMFEHECEEKRLNKVEISDMDPEVCEEMLSYIYSGKVKELDRYVMELLEVADKYQLDSLKTFCEQYLSANLAIESAANVLILADMHRANELKLKCLDYIWDNASQVKATEGWKKLNSARPLLLGEFFDHLAKKYNK